MGSELAYLWKAAEWEAGGLTAVFFGAASVIIFLWELGGAQPPNFSLLLFGAVCLLLGWGALKEALRRSDGGWN